MPEERRNLIKDSGLNQQKTQETITPADRPNARLYPTNLRGKNSIASADQGQQRKQSDERIAAQKTRSEMFGQMLMENVSSNRPAWDVRPIK